MPVPQWLQANPFRILRLSADASIAETHKAASAMRRMTVLGMLNTSDADVPSLGDVPRTETDIRAAVGRLENPAQRIADRLFWIQSPIEKPETANAGAPLKKAAREHDEAWNGLVRIYTLRELPDDAAAWIAPLRLWQQTIENDDYWKLSIALDQLGAFEPPASADEFSGLRARAMMLASEPLIMLARQAVANGDRRALEMALRILRELSDTGDWPASARKEILAPLRNSVSEQCRLNRENFGKRIVRHSDSAAANSQICNDALRDFRASVETSFTNLGASLAEADTEKLEASEEVARCLSDIAIDFTWADRYLESEELFKEALSLAQGTLAAVQIERSLAENKDSADHQRVYEGLSPESMQALKGAQKACQSVLADGRKQILREQDKSDHNRPLCQAMLARFRSEIQPAMTLALTQVGTEHPATKELRAEVALCLNLIATDFTWADEFVLALKLRQEALAIGVNTHVVESISQGIAQISESARQERMFRELKPIKSTPGLSTINGIGGRLYGSSDLDPSTNSFATTYYFTFLYFPIFPISRYRVIQEGKSYRFLGKLPFRKFDKWHLGIVLSLLVIAVVYGIATSDSGAQSGQSTYQPTTTSNASEVSPSSVTRSDLKTQIDAGRARLEVLNTELEPVVTELGSLKTQIQALDSQIKALDDRKSSGEDIDVDDYNSKVNQYNRLISRRKALYTEHESSLDEYQQLSKKDDELVAQYNALPR
jgi:hypothetical protein